MPKSDDIPYPPSPADVPEGYTDYSASHVKRERTLNACLLVFLVMYAGLVFLALFSIIVLILLLPQLHIFSILGILLLLPVIIFLVKGLFKRQEIDKEMHIELTEAENPKLFKFIRQLCDEVGVAEPRKVLVSPDVNAAVIMRTTLLNVFVPPKKDLLIGLGLVNTLNLSEFKAALAHEFGHFAQGGRSGGYFYAVARICDDMVYGRDWFDRFVDGLKSMRHAVAVFGWVLWAGVAGFRWSVEKFFGLIAFQRFTVRQEQEFHADRVAASLAGSNAIVHTLYRLGTASEAFGMAMNDLRKAADHKLYSADIYFHHHGAMDILRRKKKDPYLGKPPVLKVPEEGRLIQVFDPDIDEDPRDEGDYHPPNYEREENVKKEFVAAPEDHRPAWLIFDDPADVRERMTYKLYRTGLKISKKVELEDPRNVQKFIDDEHAETTYDDKYEGAYDDRLIDPGSIDELNDIIRKQPWDDKRLATVYDKMYSGLKTKTEERKEVSDELDKLMQESGGASNKRLRRIIQEQEEKLEDLDTWFFALDRRAYLVLVQMAYRVNEAAYYDLIGRYRFHMALQGIYRKARHHSRQADFFIGVIVNAKEVDPDLFAEVSHVLRDARKALKKVLREADEINMPAMKNFVEGEKLGHFLLNEEVVRELSSNIIKGKWLDKLMNQLGEVQAKAARLHFKSLGGILALQEKIAADFLAKQKQTAP